jgi:dCTP deaminase
MNDPTTVPEIFADEEEATARSGAISHTGILPYQAIRQMVRERQIVSSHEIKSDQIQPASIDLRLGNRAYRVRASFLPGQHTVMSRVEQLDAYEVDISKGAVLERECVHIVPLTESLRLPKSLAGFANPKSTTGRLDILTRLLTDRGKAFDHIEAGYSGSLYIEIVPRTFSVVVREGTRLNQIRFRRGMPTLAASEFQLLFPKDQPAEPISRRPGERLLGVTIDLEGKCPNTPVGYRAKKHTDRIDLEKIAYYDPLDFWEPIIARPGHPLILDPNDFYILMTRENVRVPPHLAAEMVAYDATVGEFRVHYAGFFDPGFGWEARNGATAVLEVRSHDVPFMLEHGQTVGWLRYERMAAAPDKLYGIAVGSSYQRQKLKLAKQFREPN